MAAEVLFPKLGATMESGSILRWYKEEGEPVKAGEILLEIMTDKINMELEAETSGVLLKKLYNENDVVPVNQVIAYIGRSDEPSASGIHSIADEKIRATPAAKRLAREQQMDLNQIKGSGPNGRIQQVDVEAFAKGTANRQKVTPLAEKIARNEQLNLAEIQGSGAHGKIMSQDVKEYSRENRQLIPSAGDSVNKVPVEGIRKVIARRMAESAFTAPHVTMTTDVDMRHAIKIREQLLPAIEKQTGERLSFTEIIVKAAAYALRNHPMVNSSMQGDYIVLNSDVHIGLAVAVANGLVVPVVRDCDQKGLAALTQECKTLGRLARENKLTLDQMSGGTFTISNLGMYAVDVFTPIINQPESAILGVGRILEKPAGVNGAIELRPMMTLSLSFDHRVMDGAPAAAFLTELKEVLENPVLMLG